MRYTLQVATIVVKLSVNQLILIPFNGIFEYPAKFDILSDNEKIYLVTESDRAGNGEIYFTSSNDSGKTFGEPINISNSNGIHHFLA